MKKDIHISRREFALLSANIGVASFALSTLGLTSPASASQTRVRLGHFSSPNQQNYARATGAMQKALGPEPDVQFVGISGGPQILTAMTSNDMDLCNIGSSAMIVGFAKGVPISMIYVHKTIKEAEALIVRPESGIKTIADLRGKRIACPFNTTVHFALLAGMKSAGLSASDATLVNLKPDGIAAAWNSGSIDAAYIWFPVLAMLEREGGKIIFNGSDLIRQGTFVFDGIIVRDSFKKEHPDLVLAYLQELNRINVIYRENPEIMAETMSTFLQITKEDALQYAKTTYTLTPEEMLTDKWMGGPGAKNTGVLNAIDQQANFLHGAGQLSTIPDDFSSFIDSSFLARMI